MKTPLSREILSNWTLLDQPKYNLTVPDLLAQQAALGRQIGLLLDLSNHDCLYSDDIPPDVEYNHIQLVAKELPPPAFVDAVIVAAREFWGRHPDKFIAVHCAYGELRGRGPAMALRMRARRGIKAASNGAGWQPAQAGRVETAVCAIPYAAVW